MHVRGISKRLWRAVDAWLGHGETTLVAFFHHHGVRADELIAKRIALLKEGMALTADAGVVLPSMLTTKALVAALRALLVGIEEFDETIARVFKSHPDAFICSSLPGAGPTFAPRLLCALGTQRERFDSAAALQMYLGIAPVTERSGKSTWVHWRWACPKFLRQGMVEWAGMSRRYSLWAAACYTEQRERGKAHHAAVRALAFKWLRILYRCWQEHKPYDEVAYLKALQQRGSPLLQRIAQPPSKAA
jgi:transposase